MKFSKKMIGALVAFGFFVLVYGLSWVRVTRQVTPERAVIRFSSEKGIPHFLVSATVYGCVGNPEIVKLSPLHFQHIVEGERQVITIENYERTQSIFHLDNCTGLTGVYDVLPLDMDWIRKHPQSELVVRLLNQENTFHLSLEKDILRLSSVQLVNVRVPDKPYPKPYDGMDELKLEQVN